jgi:chorismate-pyruvate lyase
MYSHLNKGPLGMFLSKKKKEERKKVKVIEQKKLQWEGRNKLWS